MELKIREITQGDQKEVINLIISVVKEISGHEPYNRDDYENFQSFYRSQNGIFYVAQIGSKIVGTIALKQEENLIGRIRRMYVHKDFRNEGIASKLIEEVINFAKNNQYDELMLNTYPSYMQDAIKLYSKFGFKKYKEEKTFIYMNKKL